MQELVSELDKLRVEARQKEANAEGIIQTVMDELDNWDKGTKKLVSQLNLARDKQVIRHSVVLAPDTDFSLSKMRD